MSSISIKEYFAQAGSNFTNADAKIIGPVLGELASAGDVTETAIIDAARSSNSPLRSYFTWDDKEAAHEYRKIQARDIIQNIRVRFVANDKKEYSTRAYNIVVHENYEKKNLPREAPSSVDSLITNEEKLMDALRDLDAWKIKYGHLKHMKFAAEILVPILNQIAEFKDDVSASGEAIDIDAAIKEITVWRDTVQKNISASTICGEHLQYISDAIEHAWSELAKKNKDKFVRDRAIEIENEKLKARIFYFEESLKGEEMMPTEFRLTPTEQILLSNMLDREVLTEALGMAALYSDRPDDEPDSSILKVLICKIRDKVEPFGIEIKTNWGVGYELTKKSKEEIRGMIAARKSNA